MCTFVISIELPSDTCDMSQDDVSCTFDYGHMCAWDFGMATQNYWQVGSGLVGNGPYALNGSAAGEGFAYVDSSTLPFPNYPVEMDTRIVPPTNTKLTFWYHAFGHGVSSLSLLLKVGNDRYLLWTTHSSRRDWVQAEVEVCSDQSHQVRSSEQISSLMSDFISVNQSS